MKVAFDARYLGPKASGIGTYTENVLRELLELRRDLSLLLVVRKRGVSARFDPDRCEELVFDVEPRSLRTLHLLPRKLRGRDHQLFHGPFNIIPSGLDRPAVVTIHDLMQIQNPANISTSSFVQQTAGLFWRRRIAHAALNAAHVLTVSAATRDALLEYFPSVPEDHVSVSPNGTDPYFREAPSDAEIARARRQIGTDAPYVLTVGNESPHKNHHRAVEAFLDAFGTDDPMRMVLVRRSVRHDPRMAALLGRAEVRARVIVLDHVDRPTLRALYAAARIFFFPSWVEGFGLPILEAMACRCPVLCGDRSAPAEVAGDAALLANPFSVMELATGLRRLDADEALRARLIERGESRVASYTWRRCAKATLVGYEHALRSR